MQTLSDVMSDRVRRLRQESLDGRPSISIERAELLTEFYVANEGKHSVPVMRALAFFHLCEHKTIYIGDGELIVGERGPEPGAVPTGSTTGARPSKPSITSSTGHRSGQFRWSQSRTASSPTRSIR